LGKSILLFVHPKKIKVKKKIDFSNENLRSWKNGLLKKNPNMEKNTQGAIRGYRQIYPHPFSGIFFEKQKGVFLRREKSHAFNGKSCIYFRYYCVVQDMKRDLHDFFYSFK